MKSFTKKTTIKKVVAGLCLTVLCTGSVLTVQAAPSPTGSDLKPQITTTRPSQTTNSNSSSNTGSQTTTESNAQARTTTIIDTSKVVTVDADTTRYENKAVAEVIAKTQDKQQTVTAEEVVEEIVKANAEVNKDKGPVTAFKAINGDEINLTMYDMATAFTDIALNEDNVIKYVSGAKVEAKVKVEALKNEKAEDLVIMQVDTITGEVYLIPVKELDPETGELTAEFQTLGTFTVLKKLPVAITDIAKTEFADAEIAKNVKSLATDEEKNKKVTLTEVLGAFKQDTKEVTSESGKTYDASKYVGATNLASLAIKKNDNEYLFNMKGKIHVDAHVNTDSIDLDQIIEQVYPDANLDEVKKDPSKLEELGEKSLEDGFISVTNPETGETKIIDDLKISFAKAETDDVTGKAESVSENMLAKVQNLFCQTVYAADGATNSLTKWNVEDERAYTGDMDLVISTDVDSMGAFMMFLPEKAATATDTAATSSTDVATQSPVKMIVIVVIAVVVVAGVFAGVKAGKRKKK